VTPNVSYKKGGGAPPRKIGLMASCRVTIAPLERNTKKKGAISMVALETPEVQIGWKAADFSLLGVDGEKYSPEDVKGPNGLVLMFICNHCPYVQAIIDKITKDMASLKALGVGSIAICSNDAEQYPEDNMENMKKLSAQKGFSFPYVQDETQEIARLYDAVCTPDFFGFNKDLELQYRGRLDESGMQDTPASSRDLYEAMKVIAETGKGPEEQRPSIGCSIKWRQEAA